MCSRQKCTTVFACLAIVFLVTVIVTVWVMLSQGAFRPEPQGGGLYGTPTSTMPTRHKDYIEKSHLDDLRSADMDFVKPLKISPAPLHSHDIIYDQMRNDHEKPPLRHHSGHFRHRQAEVWDPHPRYVIRAFGRELLLELEYDDKFVATGVDVHDFFENYTHWKKQDKKSFGCFYTGKVKNDNDSDVVVNLCHGMTGYIRTSQDTYYIEPAERKVDFLSSFLHRIKKVPHRVDTDGNNVVFDDVDHCDSHDNHTIVEDNLLNEIVEMPPAKRTKREVLVDEINHVDSWPRPTRGANWMLEDRKSEYFIKVLAVADESMIKYHTNDDHLKNYILTLMAHVALLFRDASIGNSISLSVVNIWILPNTVFDYSNSQVALRKFCEYQHRQQLDRNYDAAVLFTRDPICTNSTAGKCQTLGTAEVGSICNPSSSCSIVRDRGLTTSYTIAHELGHMLNMHHDELEPCAKYRRGPKSERIMAMTLNNETKPWKWSECSKHFLTEFLESSRAKCLSEAPLNNFISSKIPVILPGQTFGLDRQCELEHGSGYKQCTYKEEVYCKALWCSLDEGGTGCITNSMPWADGTPCGHEGLCYHRECVPKNPSLFTSVAGGWGVWQPWGECSRPCGGGIKKTERYCDTPVPENGGSFCTGRSVQYQSCNIQPCESGAPDFREIQCAQFDGITKNLPNLTKDVQWVPKYGLSAKDELCKLYCRPRNSNAYYLLKEKVVDGTKCGLNSFDICVNGICRPGGCDNALDSETVLDECGVCGGDNSKCEEITGSYNVSMTGYRRVLRIPRGSSNIDIRQNVNNDTNYLVLTDGETDQFIINSQSMITPQEKEVIFGGVIISYSGSSASIERIKTPKNHRLTKDLILGVLAMHGSPPTDITYRYIINQDNAPRYGWRLYDKQWSKCNSICTGAQFRSPDCVDLATGKEVPDSYCPEAERQHHTQKQKCNIHCQLRWNDVSRGPCSANCGEGLRAVYYNCVKIDLSKETYTPISQKIVDEKHCAILPKPPKSEPCQGACESTRWEYSDWSECSRSCGGGTQRRSATCIDHRNQQIDANHCANSEKIAEQRCNVAKCPVWSFRHRSACSVTCGRGVMKKYYYCHVDGRIHQSSACDPRQREVEEEECVERPCSSWSVGEWGECSVSCGEGSQRREVFCEDADEKKKVSNEFCDALKPNSTRSCGASCAQALPYLRSVDVENEINRFRWITGAWSQCSKTCAGGTSSRMVICRSDNGEEDDSYCLYTPRPVSTIECNPQPCPTWNFGPWTNCDSNCEKHRQVNCRNSTSTVDDYHCDLRTRPSPFSKCDQCKEVGSRVRWKVGKWKPCSTTCGKGFRRRPIECEDVLNRATVVDDFCSHLPKPKERKPCERYNCRHVWLEGDWSSCSTSCGKGVKTRLVRCHKVFEGGIVDSNPLPEKNFRRGEFCDIYHKPSPNSACSMGRCEDGYVWHVGPWKQCSERCGKRGRQTRQVFCVSLHGKQRVQKHLCRSPKPHRKKKCNQWKCVYGSCREIQRNTKTKENKDYVISIRNKLATVYCYKMDTSDPEEFISFQGDSANFAEKYDKRLKNPSVCPRQGERMNDCDCLQIGPERSGVTVFWKVRLNITSLRIIGDDFTFSRQNRGMKVPYGTAGDCYSAIEGCSQARFSIDLTGTSFKLNENVRWLSVGRYATSRIHFTKNGVDGKCGGYCGHCVTDSNVGLKVEIT